MGARAHLDWACDPELGAEVEVNVPEGDAEDFNGDGVLVTGYDVLLRRGGERDGQVLAGDRRVRVDITSGDSEVLGAAGLEVVGVGRRGQEQEDGLGRTA